MYLQVRKDEAFRRISLTDLLQLMVAYSEDCQEPELLTKSCQSLPDNENSEKVPIKYRDEVESCVHQMEECSVCIH